MEKRELEVLAQLGQASSEFPSAHQSWDHTSLSRINIVIFSQQMDLIS